MTWLFITVAELAYLIRTRALTSVRADTNIPRPIDRFDAQLNVIVTLTEELAP